MIDSPFKNIKTPVNGQGVVDLNDSNLKFGTIITELLPYFFGIVGIVLLLNIISSGLKMMTSKGDPKALGAAQAKLTTSAIGILIVFVSFWLVQLLFDFLGIDTKMFN